MGGDVTGDERGGKIKLATPVKNSRFWPAIDY